MISLQKRCDKSLVGSFVNQSPQENFRKIQQKYLKLLSIPHFKVENQVQPTIEAIIEFEKNIGKSFRALQTISHIIGMKM